MKKIGALPISRFSKSFEKSKDRFDKEDEGDQFRKKSKSVDMLTDRLGCTSYFHKMRWPWFVMEYGGLNHPLEVDRYYHEQKIAIDFGKIHVNFFNKKTSILKENGIKYILLSDAEDLKTLAMELS